MEGAEGAGPNELSSDAAPEAGASEKGLACGPPESSLSINSATGVPGSSGFAKGWMTRSAKLPGRGVENGAVGCGRPLVGVVEAAGGVLLLLLAVGAGDVGGVGVGVEGWFVRGGGDIDGAGRGAVGA